MVFSLLVYSDRSFVIVQGSHPHDLSFYPVFFFWIGSFSCSCLRSRLPKDGRKSQELGTCYLNMTKVLYRIGKDNTGVRVITNKKV